MTTDLKYQIRKRATTIAPLTGAIGLALASTQLQASTITVETLQDSAPDPFGPCTLRSAIYASLSQMNEGGCPAGSGNDTIVFADGLTGTLELDEGVSSGFGEGAALAIMSSVTIAGPGANVITIDGAESGPVFHVRPQDGTSFPSDLETVTISGLTITNGLTTGKGGGIRANAPELVLEDVVVTGNQAQTGGGGVWQYETWGYGDLTVRNSVISNNLTVTGNGGGVGFVSAYGGVTVRIEDSDFLNNQALTNEGGGFSMSDGWYTYSSTSLIMTGNEFIGNQGRYAGGGAHVYQGHLTAEISGNLFLDNTATGEGHGGGLYLAEHPDTFFKIVQVNLNNNYFEGNLAIGNGGGAHIRLDEDSNYASYRNVYLEDNQWIDNEAYNRSGGVYITANDVAYLSIQGDEFHGNRAAHFGGGLGLIARDTDLVYFNGLVLDDNHLYFDEDFGSQQNGGGFLAAVIDGVFVKNDLTVTNNSAASFGGGGFVQPWNEAYSFLFDSRFEGNQAGVDGGALNVSSIGQSTVVDGLVARDNSAERGGGGIAIINLQTEASTHFLSRSELSGNQAEQGAGIKFRNLSNEETLFRVSNSTVSGNTASSSGGGVMINDENESLEFQLRYSTIAFNQADSEAGGLNFGDADCEILNSIVADNSASTGPDLFGQSPCQLAYSLISNAANAPITVGSGVLLNTDPQLGPLANNGGASLTHAIDADSPAYNAGDRQSIYFLPFDQRGPGFDRIMFGALDMGAYEFQNRTDELFQDRFETP
jgi:hypothetical protein